MLCLFALMLLSPVAANASVADQLDAQREAMAQATEAPPEGDQAEPTEEPFVEPTEEPFVEPTEEPVVESTEEPQGEQLGAIEIEYRECQAGYDIPGTDPETVLMECNQVDGLEFQIDTNDGGSRAQMTGEFGDSHVSFTEVPTGPTTIRQIDAPGDVYVTCNGIVQNGGPETGDMPLTVNANDTSVQWTLLDDEVAFCTWFAMTEGEQVGAVEVEYRECAEGYVFLDGTDEDLLDQ
ncbi:MAG: PT domain-containing protein, partial [Chloroflexota bacterium]|nr:PT domain-containing protein [Chloroflexota bacterium]